MTNFSQVQGNGKRGGNQKDGHGPDRRQIKAQRQADEEQWLDTGFEYQWIRNAPRLTYTWTGDFPIFEVTPGIANDQAGQFRAGMVARNSDAGFELCFPYGTPPVDIAGRLDDEVLKILRLQADVDTPLDWKPSEDWNDIDDFMSGKWVRS